jgi:hypothetical protein
MWFLPFFFYNFNSFLPIDAKSCWESFLMPLGFFFNKKNAHLNNAPTEKKWEKEHQNNK